MGQSCPNQVWAKLSTGVHQRPEVSISKLHFDNPFQEYPTCPPFMSPDTEHLAPENPGARCRHLAPGTSPKPGKWGIPEKSLQNAVQKCLFQVASAPQSKVMAQTGLGQLCPMYSALIPLL